ncbi:MAG: phenylalanine--tRNA ligase subunit beta [Bacteroidia bacterium]|nr:phenylalanine--tRNA ligase subunit beta [Bacteroidia bacterium]
MKLSYNWLKQYASHNWSPEELAYQLTMTGLEVESTEKYETIPGGLEGVVVGHVKTVIPHPDADRLRVTTVDVGGEEDLQIVCGAPNVAVGQKVPVGLVGTTLFPSEGESFTLKKSKIRGVESLGMICAEDELGLGKGHDGIMVLAADLQPGTPVSKVFNLESDYIFEVGLTPNRADGASHYGASRDISALLRKKSSLPKIEFAGGTPAEANPFTIELPEPDKCPRYAGIYISGVKVAESPDWLKHRLKSIGLRPKNNVVDITNFVLHELGQPLHAFDAANLTNRKIVVKTLTSDQKFTTLDEQERNLRAGQDLMICDGDKPVAIAGIMGGLGSSVTDQTTNIFLESAYFDPTTIRKTAKYLGMKTDASYRFERGVDPNMVLTAGLRAAALIQELAGGTVSVAIDQGQQNFPPFEVEYDIAYGNRIMGHEFTRGQIIELLNAVDIEVAAENGNLLQLRVPQFRVDVQRPQDVMEEILRIFGFNSVPIPRETKFSFGSDFRTKDVALQQKYYDYLAGSGWREIMTNSLTQARYANDRTVNLINSLSEEMAVMRDNLLISGLEVIEYNHNRKNFNLRLFDPGKIYWQENGKYREKEQVALFITGNSNEDHWRSKPVKTDFFALTSEMERLQNWFGFQGNTVELDDPENFDYGLALMKGNTPVAWYGRAASRHLKGRNIRGEVFYAIIDWNPLLEHWAKQKIRFVEPPKFPSSERDISMIVPDSQNYLAIRNAIQGANPKIIKAVNLTDVYKGDSIGEGRKSYLVNVVLRDDSQTLTDQKADKIMERVFGILEGEMGVEIRK